MKHLTLIFVFFFSFLSLACFVSAQNSKDSFELNRFFISSVVKQGEQVTNPISLISNRENQKFKIDYSSEGDFISIKNRNFTLNQDNSASLDVVFDSNDLSPGIYVGEIILSSQYLSTIIPTVFEIETYSLSFDVSSEIAPAFSEVSPGERFMANVNIYNIASETGSVLLNYSVKSLKGELIFSGSQTLNVNNEASINVEYLIPEDTNEGNYVFSVIASDEKNLKVGTTSSLFNVLKDISQSPPIKNNLNSYLNIAFIVITVLIVAFLIFNYYWDKKLKTSATEWNKKLTEVNKIKSPNINKEISKLEYQKKLLDKAYGKKYIRKSSYDEGIMKINEIITKLKKRL